MFSGYFFLKEKIVTCTSCHWSYWTYRSLRSLAGPSALEYCRNILRFKFQHQYLGGFPCKQLADTLEWATDSLLPDE